MIETREVVVERVVARLGDSAVPNGGADGSARTVAATGFPVRRVAPPGLSLFDFARPVAQAAADGCGIKGVIAATFSNGDRFPSLAVRLASALGLPSATPAFDVQMACSAYPYALYLAGKLADDVGGRVLVVDADIQTRFVDPADTATALVMDDAATASVVSCGPGRSRFDFYSAHADALTCAADGPIRMDGFKVFAFVATEVGRMLKAFGGDYDVFVPHRANLYMVRQLAKSLGAADRLLAPEGGFANPGSASIPVTLASVWPRGADEGRARPSGRALLAGFGAGLSAAAALVTLPPAFRAALLP